jgi:hypothetical protein
MLKLEGEGTDVAAMSLTRGGGRAARALAVKDLPR